MSNKTNCFYGSHTANSNTSYTFNKTSNYNINQYKLQKKLIQDEEEKYSQEELDYLHQKKEANYAKMIQKYKEKERNIEEQQIKAQKKEL